MEHENPFDALVNKISRNLNKQDYKTNSDRIDSSQKMDEEEILKLSNQYHPPVSPGRNVSKNTRSNVFLDLEEALNQLMKDYEKAQGQMPLESFQQKVLEWEQEVKKAKLTNEETKVLMASGTMARRFTSYWA